ncbi:DHHW family protein [uncultured Ruminococcus sp.]|uniref:DHHW family protein n=1 Tax=uncultured Ruminococcus sp. TaxID=165186 RepID=UPI00260156BD|nr:DHHW family protein [uncultured Ruminococcus sp.]
MYTPKGYKPEKESSPEHDRIVEKIKERHRTLSHSVWTDEPVLKPKKSVWLDDEEDIQPKAKPAPAYSVPKEPVKRAEPPKPVVNEPPLMNDTLKQPYKPIIPITEEKQPVKKKEFMMSFSDGEVLDVEETPIKRKRQVTMSIPLHHEEKTSAPVKNTAAEKTDRSERTERKQPKNSTSKRTVAISMPLSKQIKEPKLDVEVRSSAKTEQVKKAEKIEQNEKAEKLPRNADTKSKTEKSENSEKVKSYEKIVNDEMPVRKKSVSADDILNDAELFGDRVYGGVKKRSHHVDDDEIDRIISEVTAEFSAVKAKGTEIADIDKYDAAVKAKPAAETKKVSKAISPEKAAKAEKIAKAVSDTSKAQTAKPVIKAEKEDSESKKESAEKEETPSEPVKKTSEPKEQKTQKEPKESKERKDRKVLKKQEKPKHHETEFGFINCICTLGIIFAVFVSLLVMKRESGFIDSENRNLAEFPKFSLSSYFSGDLTSGITDYFTDTIPGRETLKKFCAGFTSHLGVTLDDTVISGNHKTVEKEELDKDKIATTTTVTAFTGKADEKDPSAAQTHKKSDESIAELPDDMDDGQFMGDVIVSGKGENVRAMSAYYGTFDVGTRYAQTINKWKEEMPDINVYNMTIPTSGAYYMPKSLKDTVSDQKDNIDNIAASLSGIINVDVFDNIGEHTDEYIYSRTDHHWQPLGAYYAAQVFAEKSGIKFPELDTYEECKIDNFVGTMYAYSNYNSELEKYPDTFIYYKPDNEYSVTYYDTSFQNAQSGDLFFDYAEGVNCYSAILNVDNEIAEITTDCDNGRVLVIFKDSFGNALVPFLTHGFSKIYVCDLRYFDLNAVDFCRYVGCTDLLFAVSITSCSTPTHIDAINNDRIQESSWNFNGAADYKSEEGPEEQEDNAQSETSGE